MAKRPTDVAVPTPDWLSPRRLLPDLAATVWLLLVATIYLARHLIDALARLTAG